jgi:hypothetical protein
MQFQPATKEQAFLKMALMGPAGSGKTYTALRFAHALGERIAVLDSEHGSASKYVGESPDGIAWAFDTLQPDTFPPTLYTDAINLAVREGYQVLVIDSLSHAWASKGGALEIKDTVGGNQWTAWRKVTPMQDEMVDAILRTPLHIIATMRSKMGYIQEQGESGKSAIVKVGMEPVQRPGIEYEFDIVIDLDWGHVGVVTKSRCPAVADLMVPNPGPNLLKPIIAWLSDGEEPQGPRYGTREWALQVITPKGNRVGDLAPEQRAELVEWIGSNGKRHDHPNLWTALSILATEE